MVNNSVLQGTTWYWRQGIRKAPMHSGKSMGDMCKTKELYMPVKTEFQAQKIMGELQQNGIKMDMKKTHSSFDVVPAGSLIVFATVSMIMESSSEKENIEKLRSYILSNGGKIGENLPKTSVVGFIRNLFGRK